MASLVAVASAVVVARRVLVAPALVGHALWRPRERKLGLALDGLGRIERRRARTGNEEGGGQWETDKLENVS